MSAQRDTTRRDTASRWDLYLILLAIALAVASFLFFSVFFDEDAPPFSSEVASAFLGSIITVIITMLLLNRQSAAEKELIQEQAKSERISQLNDKILGAKVNLYNDLLGQVKQVMLCEEVSYKHQVEIQIINQQLSYYASEEVLEAFNAFAALFNEVAGDSRVTDEEREQLVAALGKLSLKIRRDLATDDKARHFDEERLSKLVESNIRSLSPAKIDEAAFLDDCDQTERAYFEQLFGCLKSADVEYAMGTKGFSIKNRRRARRQRVAWVFPTKVRRPSFQIFTSDLSAEMLAETKAFLDSYGESVDTDKTPPETITFSAEQLPVERTCELVLRLVGKQKPFSEGD